MFWGWLADHGFKAETIRLFFNNIVAKDSGCWEWTGSQRRPGGGKPYGHCPMGAAHRVAYRIFHGQIPAGHEIDHVFAKGCRSTLCVNPAHLEAVTRAENIRRAVQAWKIEPFDLSCAVAAGRARTEKDSHETFLRGYLRRLLGKPDTRAFGCSRAGYQAAMTHTANGRPWREHAEAAWRRYSEHRKSA